MMALSIRQPWAWLIMEGFKPLENRNWDPRYLRVQLGLAKPPCFIEVHAAKGITRSEYAEAVAFARRCGVQRVPELERLERGGVIGSVKFCGVVEYSRSPWFTGPIALVLECPLPMPIYHCPGQLGFFKALR